MFKYKVDGLHTDLKRTKAKIVIDSNGETLSELIKSNGNTSYFIMLPEELVTHCLPSVYDSNRYYISIYRSSLAFGDKSWDFDQINNIELT